MNDILNEKAKQEIIARYTENPELIMIDQNSAPEVKEAREALRQNPQLIIDCIARSKELLESYQNAYDLAIAEIAKALGVTESDKDKLVLALEARTVETESKYIQENYKNNGKLAVCMLGMGGTGKGTLIAQSRYPRIVNHTTRAARPGEAEGKDYYYLLGVGEDDELEPLVGPMLAVLVRPGRGRYITTLKAVRDVFENSNVAFLEQGGPEQIAEVAKKGKELFPEMRVQPVCVLPPGRGILEIATRIVVRTYGDPVHQDPNSDGYRINDSYFESTMGMNQISEVADTIKFINPETKSGVAYVVNDDLTRANRILDELISPK